MGKKKRYKKHQFKDRTAVSGRQTETLAPAATTVAPVSVESGAVQHGHLAFVRRDVRKVLILATAFVSLQLILWYLFQATSLGTHIYNLIKI